MAVRVLTVDSQVDAVTTMALNFREPNLYAFLNPPRARLERRQGILAVRASVLPVTAGGDLAMIMGVGHGIPSAFGGQDGLPVFNVGSFSAGEVQSRGIHLTSCSTAASLGPSMVRAGAKFFIGYVQDLLFPVQLASYVFDADCEVDRGLIEGQTAGQAHQRAINRYSHYIDAFTRQRNTYFAQYLQYNLAILRGPLNDPAYGNPSATLS